MKSMDIKVQSAESLGLKTFEQLITSLEEDQTVKPTGCFRNVNGFQMRQFAVCKILIDDEGDEYLDELYFDEAID